MIPARKLGRIFGGMLVLASGLLACGREVPEGYVKVHFQMGRPQGAGGGFNALATCQRIQNLFLVDQFQGLPEIFKFDNYELNDTLTAGTGGLLKAQMDLLLRKGGPRRLEVTGFARKCIPLDDVSNEFYPVVGTLAGLDLNASSDVSVPTQIATTVVTHQASPPMSPPGDPFVVLKLPQPNFDQLPTLPNAVDYNVGILQPITGAYAPALACLTATASFPTQTYFYPVPLARKFRLVARLFAYASGSCSTTLLATQCLDVDLTQTTPPANGLVDLSTRTFGACP